MKNLQSLPIEPEQITTANATDLATAITLVNDLKAKFNSLVNDFSLPLLGELNNHVTTTNFNEVVNNG